MANPASCAGYPGNEGAIPVLIMDFLQEKYNDIKGKMTLCGESRWSEPVRVGGKFDVVIKVSKTESFVDYFFEKGIKKAVRAYIELEGEVVDGKDVVSPTKIDIYSPE